VLGFLWARDGGERLRQNLAFAVAFAVVTTTALLIDKPYAGVGAVEVDRLSAPYQCFTMLVLLACTVLWFMWFMLRWNADKVPVAWPRRLFCGLAVGAFAALIWIALYPEVLGGPFGQIDPLVHTTISPYARDFQPITVNLPTFIEFTYTALLG